MRTPSVTPDYSGTGRQWIFPACIITPLVLHETYGPGRDDFRLRSTASASSGTRWPPAAGILACGTAAAWPPASSPGHSGGAGRRHPRLRHSGGMAAGHTFRNTVSEDGTRGVTLLLATDSSTFDPDEVQMIMGELLQDLR